MPFLHIYSARRSDFHTRLHTRRGGAFSVFRTGAFALLLIVLSGLAMPLMAHFSQNLVVRVFVAEEAKVAAGNGGTVVYQDVPVPMLFSDLLQDVGALAKDDRSALIYADMSQQVGQVRLSHAAIEADLSGFEARLIENLIWKDASGTILEPLLEGWRLSTAIERPLWETGAEAQADINRPAEDLIDPEISRATVQFALRLPTASPGSRLTATLAMPALRVPSGVQIDNHVTDLRHDPPLVFATSGQLDVPLAISPGFLDRFTEFTWQGVLHVFTGLDHVFLILCVALSPLALVPLIWRLTGFTIGHSITLITAAMGWVITSDAFIAWVEFAIALTILYAAIEALRQRAPSAIALFGVGLVHGFGFASVLSVILGPQSPAFVGSLLAFNVGIEIAQIVIVLLALGVLLALRRIGVATERWSRRAFLMIAIAMALVWSLQKFPLGW